MAINLLGILFFLSLLLGTVLIVMLFVMILHSPAPKKSKKKIKEDLGKIKDQINGK